MKSLQHKPLNPVISKSVFILVIGLGSFLLILLQVRWMKKQQPQYRDISLDQYTQIVDKQSLRIFCDNCDGAGLVRDDQHPEEMLVCPVCSGLGVHPVRFLKESDVLCPTCRGLGHIPGAQARDATVCPRCDGRGLVEEDWDKLKIPVQKMMCDHCDGLGVLRNPDNPIQLDLCPICFGLGSRMVRRMDGYDEVCPACSGMGRLIDADTHEARWCTLCKGRGLIVSGLDEDAPLPVNP